jgi:hypothetical protein
MFREKYLPLYIVFFPFTLSSPSAQQPANHLPAHAAKQVENGPVA